MCVALLQGLIFVVDSSDRERIQDAAMELQNMVHTVNPSFCSFITFRSMNLVHEAFISFSVA